MSSLVNYIQPNKFISFDNAKSISLPHELDKIDFTTRTTEKKSQVNESKSVSCVIVSSFTEKNKSYVISSFVETKGEAMISKTAVEFVEYPLGVDAPHVYTGFLEMLDFLCGVFKV